MYLHHCFLETVNFLVWEKRAKLFHHPFLPSSRIRFSLSVPPRIAKPKLLVRKMVFGVVGALYHKCCSQLGHVQHTSGSFLHHFVFLEFVHFWVCFISIVRNPLHTRRCTKAQQEKERPRHRAGGVPRTAWQETPLPQAQAASC